MSRLAARRQEFHTKVGHERWLVSYSDFITLLFGFFVVMYSISQVNESKYRSLAETLNAAFDAELIAPSEEIEIEALADIDSLANDIAQKLEGFPVQGEVSLGANENWIELTFSSELLFSSGSPAPTEAAKTVFSELAALLDGYENEVQIHGHTDNIPIRNSQYPNNWALSSARAVEIVDYLAFHGVNPDQLSAVAFGEYRPIADNATEQGRAKNRRVVVRISDQAVASSIRSPDTIFADDQSTRTGSEDSNTVNTLPNLDSITENQPADAKDDSNNQTQSKFESDKNTIQPVRLKGGDLLFTSDPKLPRSREIETSDE